MKIKNPFDTAITVRKGMPISMRDSAVELTDTLDLCWAAARAVFEQHAKPEHAIALLPMFMARSDEKRRQQEAEHLARMEAAQKRASARRRKSPGPEED